VDTSEFIVAGARAIESLALAVVTLEAEARELADVRRAGERGYFTPQEDLRLHTWFARYLTARAGLLETIEELRPVAKDNAGSVDEQSQLRVVVIAYTAAALLVRVGRCLVTQLATHKLVQRKLNDAEPRFRIPPRQYTVIRRSLTSPVNAWRLWYAMRVADEHRSAIEALADDPKLALVVAHLYEAEDSLHVRPRVLIGGRLRYRIHSLPRRRASVVQQMMFAVAEAFGRVVADVRRPWHVSRIDQGVRHHLADALEPGDVMVTRHDHALSNLFLPGYWPHAALYLGPESARNKLGISVSPQRAARWSGSKRVLEARKDGVLFRELDDTLAVDAVAVIRPRLRADKIARALAKAVTHEGKLYNFDFDFFRADRLVCTEVVCRAYDGVGGLRFKLTDRGGRPTLSAGDLLDMAVEGRGFEPVAVFGCPGCEGGLVTGPGPAAADALAESYRKP
jgi:hypothetical protein